MHNKPFQHALAGPLRRIAAGVAWAALLLLPALAAAQGNSAAHASSNGLAHGHAHQVSADLSRVIKGAGAVNARWARSTPRGLLVQVIVSADTSSDRSL